MQHASLTGSGSTGRTGHDGYLVGGEFFLFHSDRMRKYRARNSSILHTIFISCYPLGRPPRFHMARDLIQSCKTTLKRELFTWIEPLYWIKPSFLNLFIKKLTRDRVVPIISANISCDTLGSTFLGSPGLP
jgi:hypothetical protein